MDRRNFLKISLMAAGTMLYPVSVAATVKNLLFPRRRLSFYNTQTQENLTVTYFESGEYSSASLQKINYLLRDHRTGEIQPIERDLLDLLFAITQTAKNRAPIHIISGYRSPSTNAMLRRRNKSVASGSLHMLGKAADIRFVDCPSRRLREIAIRLSAGGVGFYPRNNFVHVDTGPVRTW